MPRVAAKRSARRPAGKRPSDFSGPKPSTDELFRRFRQGESVASLAKQCRQTKATITRLLLERRLQRVLALDLAYVPNEDFDGFAWLPIRGPEPPGEGPVLTREQEVDLFRKHNYLKHCAGKRRRQLDLDRPSPVVIGQIERLYDDAVDIRNRILEANQPLVKAVAKEQMEPGEDWSTTVSDGNLGLLRAVETFDYAKGTKFSSYATQAIRWAIWKSRRNEAQEQSRFKTNMRGDGRYELHDRDFFEQTPDDRSIETKQEETAELSRQQVAQLLEHLEPREREVIEQRFGLKGEPTSFKEIGVGMGIGTERVRQIVVRALARLRTAARREGIE
jgi:RNA polymerase primary sigma factor/RNA polymerase sigma factor